jgi:ATP-dependent Lon protease
MGGETQSAVSLKYIETLLEIPWNEATEEIKDISLAEKILN